VLEENAAEENGISNRQLSATFTPPLTVIIPYKIGALVA
jgi:hypothetical protein